MKRLLFTVLCLVGVMSLSYGQSITGKWKTIDDETKEVKSIVEIYMKDGKAHGRIVKLYNKSADALCVECTDHRKNKPLVGLEIITALEKDGKYWEADDGILDPAKGSIYYCKAWLEEKDVLKVRGYIGFVYRTQTWHRVK